MSAPVKAVPSELGASVALASPGRRPWWAFWRPREPRARELDAWGTKAVDGSVWMQLTDDRGKVERYRTTPAFARDLSNRLLATAAQAQGQLQGVAEGGG